MTSSHMLVLHHGKKFWFGLRFFASILTFANSFMALSLVYCITFVTLWREGQVHPLVPKRSYKDVKMGILSFVFPVLEL